MKSYKQNVFIESGMEGIKAMEGTPIERKMERIIANKEPVTEGAPLLYTERKDGVKASTNIRTDRWEVAIEGMDKVSKSYKARREERAKGSQDPKDGGAESTQGTKPEGDKTK